MPQVLNSNALHLKIPAELQHLEVLGKKIRQFLADIPDLAEPESTLYNVELVIQELAANIVTHAYAGKEGEIFLSATLVETPRQLSVKLEDFGTPFHADEVAEPRLGELQEHGFGLFLVRQLVDKLEYQRVDDKNSWSFEMKLI